MKIGHLVLIVAVVVSALSLVTAQQRHRRAFVELERARDEQRKLDQQWAQLQLDQTAWGKHSLIEQTARQQLGMRPVTPDRTQYVNTNDAVASDARDAATDHKTASDAQVGPTANSSAAASDDPRGASAVNKAPLAAPTR